MRPVRDFRLAQMMPNYGNQTLYGGVACFEIPHLVR